MSNACLCARTPICKVVVVGLKGDQFHALGGLLSRYPIAIRSLSPEKLLRVEGVDGLVVLTRFVKHKHSNRAEQIARGHVVRVPRGAASAVANAIIEFYTSEVSYGIVQPVTVAEG